MLESHCLTLTTKRHVRVENNNEKSCRLTNDEYETQNISSALTQFTFILMKTIETV